MWRCKALRRRDRRDPRRARAIDGLVTNAAIATGTGIEDDEFDTVGRRASRST
jgi:hypothetical protein